MNYVKIFISHSSQDYDLAKTLKNILEKSDLIKEAFVYEDKKRLGMQISEKITNEINSSDYVVALITKNSIGSASVNQEYGYAQAKNLQKIPFLEEGSEEGIVVFGTEKISFSQENFLEKCVEVKKYLLDSGLPNKVSDDEIFFIQKFAHFRYSLDDHILHLISDFSTLLNTGYDPYKEGLFTEESRRHTAKLLLEYIEDKQKLLSKLQKLRIEVFSQIGSDYVRFKGYLKDDKRFPHSELLPDEQDALMKLNDRILEINENYFDIAQYLGTLIPRETLDYNSTFEEMLDKHKELPSLPMNLSSFMLDLRGLINAVCQTYYALEDIRKKFGRLAFKDTFDLDTA